MPDCSMSSAPNRKWTAGDEQTLIDGHVLLGSKWVQISRRFQPARSELEVKNHYYSALRSKRVLKTGKKPSLLHAYSSLYASVPVAETRTPDQRRALLERAREVAATPGAAMQSSSNSNVSGAVAPSFGRLSDSGISTLSGASDTCFHRFSFDGTLNLSMPSSSTAASPSLRFSMNGGLSTASLTGASMTFRRHSSSGTSLPPLSSSPFAGHRVISTVSGCTASEVMFGSSLYNGTVDCHRASSSGSFVPHFNHEQQQLCSNLAAIDMDDEAAMMWEGLIKPEVAVAPVMSSEAAGAPVVQRPPMVQCKSTFQGLMDLILNSPCAV